MNMDPAQEYRRAGDYDARGDAFHRRLAVVCAGVVARRKAAAGELVAHSDTMPDMLRRPVATDWHLIPPGVWWPMNLTPPPKWNPQAACRLVGVEYRDTYVEQLARHMTEAEKPDPFLRLAVIADSFAFAGGLEKAQAVLGAVVLADVEAKIARLCVRNP